MSIEEQFRPPTAAETELIERLLTADFPGKRELADQLGGCRVRILDEEGSLQFEVNSTAQPATVDHPIPVEAEAPDADGVHVHFLLHVVNGRAHEFEIYKDDGTPIQRMPLANELDVMVLGP